MGIREGLFEVVGDGQCQRADGVSGETEGAAPSGFQAAFVLDHGKGFLDGVAAAVAFVVCGGAERDVLVGIEQVGWDATYTVFVSADKWDARCYSARIEA